MTSAEGKRSAQEQLAEYRSRLSNEVGALSSALATSRDSTQVFEVVTGIVAYQASLVSRMAECVHLWDRDVGQIIVRSIVEAHINLAWIMEEPEGRSAKFVHYGLGQMKLGFEHFKDAASGDEDAKAYISELEQAINSERHLWITEVNLGSWSGEDLRSMAESVGLRDAYRLVYQPMSGVVHGMWHHLLQSVMVECDNELHVPHRRPTIPEYRQDIFLFTYAVGQVEQCLQMIRKHYELPEVVESAADYILQELEKFGEANGTIAAEGGPIGDKA